MWQSSNPVLANNDAFEQYYGRNAINANEQANVTTLQGVVNKTAILITVAVAAGMLGYWLLRQFPATPVILISCIASMVICFGVGLVLSRKPQLAVTLAPVYAMVEGVFLGALSSALDLWLEGLKIAALGGVALQAFIITISIVLAMLVLYSARILQPTQMFVSMVKVATFGIMITYALTWVAYLLFNTDLPLIGLSSAFGSGWTPLIGLGINLFILGVASMWLIIDFKMIEDNINAAAPKYMEWYCGFALLVTIAWIYYEALKLVFRLAILLSNRE